MKRWALEVGGTAASGDSLVLERFVAGAISFVVFGAGLGGFLDLERVDLGIVEGAEPFRRSSFAAAIQLNELECFELERPQPHDLVTRQPCHAVIAAVKAQTTLCDRLSTIENQLPKSNRET